MLDVTRRFRTLRRNGVVPADGFPLCGKEGEDHMKQYVVDELRPADYERLKSRLDDDYGHSRVDRLYWIPLDPDILNATQRKHADCQPFYYAIDLEPKLISCEFLIRTLKKVRCDCIAYADEDQRNGMIRFVDGLFDELDIVT